MGSRTNGENFDEQRYLDRHYRRRLQQWCQLERVPVVTPAVRADNTNDERRPIKPADPLIPPQMVSAPRRLHRARPLSAKSRHAQQQNQRPLSANSGRAVATAWAQVKLVTTG
jgi:hypothetical protein